MTTSRATAMLGGRPYIQAVAAVAAWAALSVACGSEPVPDPVLDSVNPSAVRVGVSVRLTAVGENFVPRLSVPLSDDPATLDRAFAVTVGSAAADPAGVEFIDTQNVAFELPPNMAVGVYPVTVTTPTGKSATLEGALEISVTGGDDCGDGTCEAAIGETACLCPEDCDAMCGDGCCTGTETQASCPEDCMPVCGDDSCDGGETSLSCEDDCGAPECSDCASGACNPACGDMCAVTCGATCQCNVDCSAGLRCDATCGETSVCDIDCTGSAGCTVGCTDRATCTFNCSGAADCTASCVDRARCELDCTGAQDCTAVVCDGMAECLLHCDGATACDFAVCPTGAVSCPDNTLACNRPCP